MKNLGVWIDGNEAFIIEKDTVTVIPSDVDHFHIHGGSGTRFKGGPQDVVHDSKYLERKKNQLKLFYKQIVSQIKHGDMIVIFGPAEIGVDFASELKRNYEYIFNKVANVIKTDRMTENQLIAWVKQYFNNEEAAK